MKNKIRMIDISIASTYMGRFLTIGVTVAVLAITLSALTGTGGMRNHRPLVLEVPVLERSRDAVAFYDPLRDLLALDTGRAVRVRVRGSQQCDECDLFVFTIEQFLGRGRSRKMVPLYSIEPLKGRRDAAVLIARKGTPMPVPPPPARQVLFSDERSFNGFCIQLQLLEAEGFAAPEGLPALEFAAAPAAGKRVVYSVALGDYALGACRASDLARAVDGGGVRRDELAVVRSRPAVPEVVVACKPEDADYYRRVLSRTAGRMASPDGAGRYRDAVELLQGRGIGSLQPVSAEQLQRAASLQRWMTNRFGGGEN